MPKRKREEVDEVPNIKQRRIQHKLKLGIAKLGHAFKVSKGFERQKLGRRRKSAGGQDSGKDVDRIDSEIAALKTLDTTTAAKQHLYKTLLKIKAVSQHPDLPSEVKKGVTAFSDTATLNVNARLCKSHPVQEALSTTLDDVQRSLGLDGEPHMSVKPRRVRAKDFVDGKLTSTAIAAGRTGDNDQHAGERDDDTESENGNDTSEVFDASLDHQPSLSEGDEDDDFDEMRRIARSESAEDASIPLARNGYNVEADFSISGSESDVHSESPEPQKAPSAIKNSSYLPSLTMAGYISGSGSDSDVPDDVELAPKKNRRGQRARQQIWEKKYGVNAKHLQKKEGAVRWDSKRGAVDGNGRRAQRNKRPDPNHALEGNGGAVKSGEDVQQTKRKAVDPNAPIHPSWEAAKKAKEKREAPVAFQGKKVVFD